MKNYEWGHPTYFQPKYTGTVIIWLHARIKIKGKPGLLLYIIFICDTNKPLQFYWNTDTNDYL